MRSLLLRRRNRADEHIEQPSEAASPLENRAPAHNILFRKEIAAGELQIVQDACRVEEDGVAAPSGEDTVATGLCRQSPLPAGSISPIREYPYTAAGCNPALIARRSPVTATSLCEFTSNQRDQRFLVDEGFCRCKIALTLRIARMQVFLRKAPWSSAPCNSRGQMPAFLTSDERRNRGYRSHLCSGILPRE